MFGIRPSLGKRVKVQNTNRKVSQIRRDQKNKECVVVCAQLLNKNSKSEREQVSEKK